MFLESTQHQRSSFVTLTYSQENLPVGGSLEPRELQLFLKRLRSSVSVPVRYFAVGEYGDLSWRPHYHLSLFGIGLESASLVQKCWRQGFSYTAEFNETTAQYVAGYVVKKMTSKQDVRLKGLHPEFARMSLKPGIGAPAANILSNSLTGIVIDQIGDVPHKLTMGKSKSIPLGRYLRAKLRELQGFTPEYKEALKNSFLQEKSADLFLLLKNELSRNPSITLRQVHQKSVVGKLRQIEARHKIQHQRGIL